MTTKFLTTAVLSLSLVGAAGFAEAGQRRGGGGGGGGGSAAGRAVPRGGATVGTAVPRTGGGRPSHGGGGPSHGGGGHYGGSYYGARYGGYYGYPYYGYPYYGYGYYPYGVSLSFGFGYGYPYGYAYGGYAYPYGGYAVAAYGGVRITEAPRGAAVYADGYYVGVVDDFDGSFQRINLEPGAHHIEIRPQGGQAPVNPVSFDVNVRPGQTITYRAY